MADRAPKTLKEPRPTPSSAQAPIPTAAPALTPAPEAAPTPEAPKPMPAAPLSTEKTLPAEHTLELHDAAPAPEAAPIIVYGVPRGAKMPVGARFAPEDATLAAWIAHHRGLRIMEATTPATQDIAASMISCHLHPTRGAILNIVPRHTFEKLLALMHTVRERISAEGDPANWAPDQGTGNTRGAVAETLWDTLAIRDVVLTPEYDVHGTIEGWWEAAILAIRGDEYVVCWIEDGETGFRRRKRHELALMYPDR